jgi:hypothetical protein
MVIETLVRPSPELTFVRPRGVDLPTAETVWFKALDGHWLNFKRLRRVDGTPNMGPVIMVHGAGVRANLFCPPNNLTLPAMLSARGFDVWILNWRASIDLRPVEWSLDDAAVLDYPAAVKVILQETNRDAAEAGTPPVTSLKALIHCQGSCSFMMALAAGRLPEVTTVVANSSGLHPVVPFMAKRKLPLAMLIFGPNVKWFDPQYGLFAPRFWPKIMDWMVGAFHHECNNAVCKHSSFVYGVGFPTMWSHDNLDDATHEWLKGEFAHVPVKFFKQMARGVAAGRLLSTGDYPEDVLPPEFGMGPPKTNATFHFVTGADNRCFLPEAMETTWEYFNEYSRTRKHTFYEFPGYGHLDVFFGKNAHNDTFPYIIEKLCG